MKASGIYKITCTGNGKVYIGSAVDLMRRWYLHQYNLKKGDHHNPKLQSAWNKYGAGAFTFETIQAVGRDGLIACEQQWLDMLRPDVHGFNVCSIAGSTLGKTHTLEARAKMSASKVGKPAYPKSSEHIEKVAAANRGKKRSPEHIAHMSKVMTGKVASAETREKMSRSGVGREVSAATAAKLSAIQKAAWTPERHEAHRARMALRPVVSDEVRAKQSASAQLRWKCGVSSATSAKMAANMVRRNAEMWLAAKADGRSTLKKTAPELEAAMGM